MVVHLSEKALKEPPKEENDEVTPKKKKPRKNDVHSADIPRSCHPDEALWKISEFKVFLELVTTVTNSKGLMVVGLMEFGQQAADFATVMHSLKSLCKVNKDVEAWFERFAKDAMEDVEEENKNRAEGAK
ncbi:hypothetical protein R1flu_024841 [Riccia fluitans]|uniref:Uncharacterized protein n=1 Tax=Riccia fluitans TaxID=41844 RepID=A0ABD1XW33_9MARC